MLHDLTVFQPRLLPSQVLLARLRQDKAEQKQLDEYMRKVPGVATGRFMIRLNQLKSKQR